MIRRSDAIQNVALGRTGGGFTPDPIEIREYAETPTRVAAWPAPRAVLWLEAPGGEEKTRPGRDAARRAHRRADKSRGAGVAFALPAGASVE